MLIPRQGERARLDLGQSVSEPVRQRLKVSREGIVLIKSFEGFRPRAIRRGDGSWMIGYGHTLSARDGASVSEADAELLLQYDLLPVTAAINDGVASALNQHQFDALASFALSVGLERFRSSDVLQRLNAGAAGEAADAMVGWPEPPLPETALRRRAAERALFVADPALAITLADLLSAPLPPPPVVSQPVDGTAPAARPFAAVPMQRYAPYSTAVVGPLPVSTAPGTAPLNATPESDAPAAEPMLTAATEPQNESGELLVLTPLAEADIKPTSRPPWSAEERQPASTEPGQAVLFDGDINATQSLGPVLRHEAPAEASEGFDWGHTGAFLFMGAVGLISFGMSMAAFRRTWQSADWTDGLALIGWVLAIVGASCVSVSSYNLYRRWGRSDE